MSENPIQSLEEKLQTVLKRDQNSDQINYNAKKSIIESLPAGAALSHFYQKYVSSPAGSRMDEFFRSVVEAIHELDKRFEEIDLDNPNFSTVLMHALQIASRNHQEEKLVALRNAVLNSALPSAPNDDLQKMYLDFIDVLTVSHIRCLKIFRHRKIGERDSSWRDIIQAEIPEAKRIDFPLEQIWIDLGNKGLIGSAYGEDFNYIYELRDFARGLLDFIAEPECIEKR